MTKNFTLGEVYACCAIAVTVAVVGGYGLVWGATTIVCAVILWPVIAITRAVNRKQHRERTQTNFSERTVAMISSGAPAELVGEINSATAALEQHGFKPKVNAAEGVVMLIVPTAKRRDIDTARERVVDVVQ